MPVFRYAGNVMKVLVRLCALAAVFLLCGCGPLENWNMTGDWNVSGLPGGYEVWRVNSRSVVLCLPDPEHPFIADTVVPEYVSELACTDQYIFAKRVDVPEDLKKTIDTSNPDYYIVDVTSRECGGPYSEDEFRKQCLKLGIEEELNWLDHRTIRDTYQEY